MSSSIVSAVDTMRDYSIDILDRLDRRFHPRQQRGFRWVAWNLVNFASSFLSFWNHCYGCGAYRACRCADKGDPAAFTIDARTAARVALTIWRPRWDSRPLVAKPRAPRIGIAAETAQLLSRLERLDINATAGPWRVECGSAPSGENWVLADFGIDEDKHAYLTTDRVRASEAGGEGAAADAEACAELRTLLPQIIDQLKSMAAFQRA